MIEIQRQTDELSQEEREGLVAYLIHGLSGMPQGPNDDEVDRREAEMDSGEVRPISHAQFMAQVGRRNA